MILGNSTLLADFDLLPYTPLPEDHDPLADGILMLHQKEWIEDDSDLKLAAKGRRTGITYVEALDDCLIAATARSAGGDNVYYIGDTKDKGLEFIRYVAHFARIVAKEVLAQIEEFLFEDKQESGDSKFIAAFRVRFASGYQVCALSSRPSNIRGLQGVVVIDEAAFHQNVQAVIEAVNALLIWGGKIRIISSHNGEDNPFNKLIKAIKKGDYEYSIHYIPFSKAVKNGLYERVCLMKGWTPSKEGFEKWLKRIYKSYGRNTEARLQELEAIPAKGAGVYFPRLLVESAQIEGVPTVHFERPTEWYLDKGRFKEATTWYEENIRPVLKGLDPAHRSVFGQDFGRDGDLSVIMVHQEEQRRWLPRLNIEWRCIPFDIQELLLDLLIRDLPLFHLGTLDARGNGQSHAEKAQQKFGLAHIVCFKATRELYALNFPKYRSALEDGTFRLPDGEDIVADHRVIIMDKGNPTMSDLHINGSDGMPRHGDSAIAAFLSWLSTTEKEERFEHFGPQDLKDAGSALAEKAMAVWGRIKGCF